MLHIDLQAGKKVYFSSDNHLGAPTYEESKPRERIFLNWLDKIQKNAQVIFLLGDLFDFWFEYKTVIPRGFVRILGKLAELSDEGVSIYFFVGNHDLWMRDYFEKELNIQVFYKPQNFQIGHKKFHIGHGDGLGSYDKGYKFMKTIFTHPLSKWLYRWLHPDIGMQLGHYFSTKNKLISGNEDITFLGEDKEWLVQYSKEVLKEKNFDFFVFGHRHLPMNIDLDKNAKYINLGDWITHYSYGIFDGQGFDLKGFDNSKPLDINISNP